MLCLTVALLLFSCKTEQHVFSSEVTIDSFSEESTVSLFEDVFSEIKVVPLLQSDEVMGSAGSMRIKQCDGKYVITDTQMGAVYLFGHDGTLISRIIKNGRGPGEYSMLQSCEYFNHKIVVLADGTRILVYSEQGDFLNEFELEYETMDFHILDNEETVLLIPLSEGEMEIEDRIILADSQMNRKSSFFPQSYQLYSFGNYLSPILDKEGAYLYIQPSSPEISFCLRDSVITKYKFQLNGKEFPETLLVADDYETMLEILTNTAEIYSIVNAYENDDYLLLAIALLENGETTKIGQWIVNKKDWTSRIEYFPIEGPEFGFLGPPQLLTPDNEVIYICETTLFDTVKDKIPSLQNLSNDFTDVYDKALLICAIRQ